MSISLKQQTHKPDRANFVGGSDARIIMGKDEKALLRLWREKRGEEPPLDLSDGRTRKLDFFSSHLSKKAEGAVKNVKR